nr:unnamed protein product [Callosobruchus analis]
MQIKKKRRFNLDKLKEAEGSIRWAMCLERAEAGSYGGILNIKDRWQAIKEKVCQSTDEALGYREQKRKDWITDRTWDLIKQRK